ncbi:MAG: bifunctional ornithine acetyltransferase/N-acetylglutamate synthase [Candidatus Rokubacteria bacterium GWC2_70_16]|nr:MAG: bifunctional ornithine acetyltransferase/N-acetylglutamate synthase [Candidatus Rokubacteria bacterium GWC2_70_16]OGL21244.1 MAG: bifunctional ornithine acetyltransferase/N-acetylglutamate synthase [Candidatus Rokubacteria bacterium RIFCSPLOWO2_12_FULL_71_19]
MPEIQWLDGGITAVPGILASGVAAGIKPSGKKDLALIYSSAPARAAAVFTTNQVKGAPVLVSQEHVRGRKAQAIVASSGCSNVCTGEQGLKDAREMTRLIGDLLHLPPQQVLIAATGVIGQPLPMDRIRAGLPKLVKALSPQGSRSAAEAIMTTDTVPKEAALRVEVGGRPVTIGGIAKGVGMLEPHLATMFCFLATDAAIAADALHVALRRAVDRSLNRVSVDGDQSTSDTVAVLANGLAENAPLERGARGLRPFRQALETITQRLALMLVQDGEGATKLVEIVVRGARTRREALVAARAVANSPLVKTAFAGADPNWGRIMMALGKSAARVLPDRLAIRIGEEPLAERGMLRGGARLDRVREIMGRRQYTVAIDLGLGRGEERVWTSDLSEEYVRINSKYTT